MAGPNIKTDGQLRTSGGHPSHAQSDIAMRNLTSLIEEPNDDGGKKSVPASLDAARVALVVALPCLAMRIAACFPSMSGGALQ